MRLILGTIAALALIHAFLVPSLLAVGIRWGIGSRLLLTIAGVAPPAVLMGVPLPLGMRGLSVMGSILAMTTSIFFGISITLALGAGAYLIATASHTAPRQQTAGISRAGPSSDQDQVMSRS